ncbi:Aste57867_11197 [Aphanomyces stellatus]|uniref:Aste57867_11197 protein n=1 Tax=Aphanomyces stellatus TaxID=120398 RepID=A0A485KTI3_9STRA|nr:hypothetical protein As57867_011155 [Aphanomyces stellatus]VFT88064.1 Aste57867_11197 [Aphanomyces stellatus]
MEPQAPSLHTLVRAIFSHYCAARHPVAFPRECFESNDTVCVPLFKRRHLGVLESAQWLHHLVEFGVGESLDHNCLQQVVFATRDSNAVVETLTLDFTDHRAKESNVQAKFMALIKTTSLVLETLPAFPLAVTFDFDMAFHTGRKPYGRWPPPYFVPPLHAMDFQGNVETIALGSVASNGLLCRISLQTPSAPSIPVAANPIAFDKYFDHSAESWYAMVKASILHSKKAQLQHVMKSFPSLEHSMAQSCFGQLVHEGILERRGRRYYMTRARKLPVEKSSIPLTLAGEKDVEPLCQSPTNVDPRPSEPIVEAQTNPEDPTDDFPSSKVALPMHPIVQTTNEVPDIAPLRLQERTSWWSSRTPLIQTDGSVPNNHDFSKTTTVWVMQPVIVVEAE